MHHAGNVKRNFGKQEITDHVLQPEYQAKQYLRHKQDNGRDKIRLGNRLRLILHETVSPLTLDVGRPIRRIDF